ncbi:MAG TPA: DNA-3-methyladenine glycosylase [Thermoleophilaceae bacterium]|nr:DNA-3-methyladenine glycosylase [Thermoleophilaceae bacterium]
MPEEAAALKHLRKSDPLMDELIERYGHPDDVRARRGRRPGDAYGALVRAIVGQQLSTKAAKSIFERLVGLFGDRTPTPRELLDVDPETLRGVGLSRAKVAFLRDLAEHVEDGELRLQELAELPDDEVAAELTAVKGLGPWTVDMFLIFHLGRPDVLPVGDLGIRRAAQLIHGLDDLPTPAELERLAEPWRPYRSLACLYLWRSLDNEPA